MIERLGSYLLSALPTLSAVKMRKEPLKSLVHGLHLSGSVSYPLACPTLPVSLKEIHPRAYYVNTSTSRWENTCSSVYASVWYTTSLLLITVKYILGVIRWGPNNWMNTRTIHVADNLARSFIITSYLPFNLRWEASGSTIAWSFANDVELKFISLRCVGVAKQMVSDGWKERLPVIEETRKFS